MISIAFFGEAMHELSEQQTTRFGGDTYNTAVYLKRLLLNRANVQFVTAIGCDELSIRAHTLWQHQQLNLQYVLHAPTRKMGEYGITTTENAEREFRYDRKDSAATAYFSLDGHQAFLTALTEKQFDYVYFSAISLAILPEPARQVFLTRIAAYKEAGGTVIFDSNYRAVLWQSQAHAQQCYQQALMLADFMFVTNDDHYGVFGPCTEQQLVSFYQAYCPALLVFKQGLDDTLVWHKAQLARYSVRAVEHALDTTAAGDAFSAGFLAEFLINHQIDEAVNTAQQLASEVIGHAGAIVETTIMPHEHSYQANG